jgi:hypothetical protein
MRFRLWAGALFFLGLCGCSPWWLGGDQVEQSLSNGHGVNFLPTSMEEKAQAGWAP